MIATLRAMPVQNTSALAQRVRKARINKGLSQEELAGEAYSAAYVSHVEHGKRNPSHEAITYFAERLGMTYDQLITGRDPDAELRLEIKIQSAIAQIHQGNPGKAWPTLEEALEEANEMSSARAARRALEGLALSFFRQGDIEAAESTYGRLADLLPESAYEERTAAIVGMGRCLFHQGKTRDAIDLLETHETRLTRSAAPDPTALLQVYAAMIGPYADLGRMDKAKEVAVKGSDVAPLSGDTEQLACLFINRAGLLLEQGEPREALMFLARAEDTYKQLGWEAEAANVNVARGMVLLEQEDLTRARAMFESVLGDEVASRVQARALTGLAQVLRRSDDPKQGLALTQKALEFVDASLAGETAEAKREAGLCAQAAGMNDEALTYWRDALALYKDAGDQAESAKTATFIGDLLMEMGRTDEAAAAYREGLSAMGELR